MNTVWAAMFCVLLLPCQFGHAQGVYRSPGANGPVFSDKPQPGASEVILPPLNVIVPPRQSAAPAASPATTSARDDGARPAAALPVYRSLLIVQPENNGSMAATTALFEVRVAVDPPLQLGAGHAFAVSVNGRRVPSRFTSTEFIIPPEFWGDELPPSGDSLQLDASIIDADGRELYQAEPVRFFIRYTPQLNRPRRPLPPPHQRPPRRVAEPLPAVGTPVGAPVGAATQPAVGAPAR